MNPARATLADAHKDQSAMYGSVHSVGQKKGIGMRIVLQWAEKRM